MKKILAFLVFIEIIIPVNAIGFTYSNPTVNEIDFNKFVANFTANKNLNCQSVLNFINNSGELSNNIIIDYCYNEIINNVGYFSVYGHLKDYSQKNNKLFNPWFNTSWKYRITNNIANGTRPYQMTLNISNSFGINNYTHVFCNGLCKDDFSDVRFTLDNNTLLPIWLNKINNVMYINLTNNGNVNMYFGNDNAVNDFNGSKTFLFFEDFESYNVGSFSTQNGWTLTGLANIINNSDAIDGKSIQFTSNTWAGIVRSKLALTDGIIESNVKGFSDGLNNFVILTQSDSDFDPQSASIFLDLRTTELDYSYNINSPTDIVPNIAITGTKNYDIGFAFHDSTNKYDVLFNSIIVKSDIAYFNSIYEAYIGLRHGSYQEVYGTFDNFRYRTYLSNPPSWNLWGNTSYLVNISEWNNSITNNKDLTISYINYDILEKSISFNASSVPIYSINWSINGINILDNSTNFTYLFNSSGIYLISATVYDTENNYRAYKNWTLNLNIYDTTSTDNVFIISKNNLISIKGNWKLKLLNSINDNIITDSNNIYLFTNSNFFVVDKNYGNILYKYDIENIKNISQSNNSIYVVKDYEVLQIFKLNYEITKKILINEIIDNIYIEGI